MKISKEKQYEHLKNCVTIEGSLMFRSFTYSNISFPNLLNIKGVLSILFIDNLTSIRQLLPNLVHIHGESPYNVSLIIMGNKDLEKLDFKKLLKISSGGVEITNNSRLCFSDIMSWSKTQALMSPLNKNIQVWEYGDNI